MALRSSNIEFWFQFFFRKKPVTDISLGTDCFTNYPAQPFQDDDYLSKPTAAYEWLHFFDRLNSAVYFSQEWELSPYLSSPVLAMHHLFASSSRPTWNANIPNNSFNTKNNSHNFSSASDSPATQPHPLSLSSAPYTALELTKQNKETLSHLQSGMALSIARMYSAPDSLATELAPYILRILSPAVNPVVVGGNSGNGNFSSGPSSSSTSSQPGSFASVRKASEKAMVARAVGCMGATGVRFTRIRVGSNESDPFNGHDKDDGNSNVHSKTPFRAEPSAWIYRMHPPVDELVAFGTMSAGTSTNTAKSSAKSRISAAATSTATANTTVRYSVRQVLDQEWKREEARLAGLARMRRGGVIADTDADVDAAVANKSTNSSCGPPGNGKEKANSAGVVTGKAVKRDFFGRPIMKAANPNKTVSNTKTSCDANDDDNNDGNIDDTDVSGQKTGLKRPKKSHRNGNGNENAGSRGRIWVSFNEGYSNAVRKPITLAELMASF